MLMGPQSSEDITIHVPHECKNKGSGLKKFVSARENAIQKENKRLRNRALCKSIVHDARKCPTRNKETVNPNIGYC